MESVNIEHRMGAIPNDKQSSYNVTIGRDNIRVVSIFSGTKTASELIHEAAVKKILYDHTEA